MTTGIRWYTGILPQMCSYILLSHIASSQQPHKTSRPLLNFSTLHTSLMWSPVVNKYYNKEKL